MRTCPSCQRTYSAGETACTVDGRELVEISLSDTFPAVAGAAASPPSFEMVALGDRYEVLRKIGEGGMGAVYEARHKKIGKRVAVKVLLDKFLEKPDLVARLLQEARLASSIGHEHIVDITDYGETEDGRTFVVMEYLDGESLAALIDREGALPVPRTIRVIRQVASALGAAHEKGIVHRDVKPENVFIIRRGDKDFVKVVDFGVSKMTKPPTEGGDLSPRLTQTGVVVGTPLYMSPEQASGEEQLDHRVDVYALGTVLYETLTGEVPFSGPNYLSIISQILSKEPRPPTEVRPDLGIPPSLEVVVLRAMAKDRAARYQTMAELDADLARVESGASLPPSAPAGRRRRATQIAGWVGGIGLIVGGLTFAVPRLVSETPLPPETRRPMVEPVVVKVPQPTLPPAPALIHAHVTSAPPGAEVWWESVKKGVTPLELELPHRDDQIELQLRLAGYDDGRALFYANKDQDVVVTLTAKPVAKPPRHRPPPPPPKPPNPNEGGPTSAGEIKPSPFGH